MRVKASEQRSQLQESAGVILQETKRPGIHVVRLQTDKRAIPLGTLDTSGEGTFRCTKKPEHLHRALNGWGINAELIERHRFKWVCVVSEGREYKTTTDVIKRFGIQRAYPGYERQYILPLEQWGIEKLGALEMASLHSTSQLSFFGELA